MSGTRLLLLGLLGVALGFPFVVGIPYFVHILIITGIYIIFALSYDLTVGRVGALSLAHPAFFGGGAYAAAILSTRFQSVYAVDLIVGVVLASILAYLVAIPSFRLSYHSFGIATLGFALIAQLFVQNQVDLTRGPLCINQIPALYLPPLVDAGIPALVQQYFLVLLGVLAMIGFTQLIATSRIGRALTAVREDDVLAASAAVSPMRYRMFVFVLGAAIAGAVGTVYAHYLTIVCPTDLGMPITVNLLVILFLGGTASVRGIVLAAFVFTALPEFLRITPTLRLIIYGLILLVSITYLPQGFEGGLRAASRRWRRGAA
jgi:ABC-type branched-subunit amino acid transport system permease subunit